MVPIFHFTFYIPMWRIWQLLLFRFFFIYFTLTVAPWTWLDAIPGVSKVTQFYNNGEDWIVRKFNAWFFHIRPELVPTAGSGDTSYGWAELCFVLTIAFVGMIIWSVLDRRRPDYRKLNYWLCVFLRYYVALVSFSYGIIKVFGLQMPFPSYSMMATPMGELFPMRFSWMFIGYSTTYQFFSGFMEVLAAMLLLYRRTATLGILLATGVFTHVAILNLSYDIPVKIYSMQMVVICFYLLANEAERILCFFILNKPANACTTYHYAYPKKWMRIGRGVFKLLFIVVAIVLPTIDSYKWYNESKDATRGMVFKPGVYMVASYVVNGDTIPPLITDTLRWQNMVFDNKRSGSIATSDTLFWKRYGRAYFMYKVDTAKQSLTILKRISDSIPVARFNYSQPDSNTIVFHGVRKTDSLSLVLRKWNRSFPLEEKQFNWITEYIK